LHLLIDLDLDLSQVTRAVVVVGGGGEAHQAMHLDNSMCPKNVWSLVAGHTTRIALGEWARDCYLRECNPFQARHYLMFAVG
jgi:hypothetical protein